MKRINTSLVLIIVILPTLLMDCGKNDLAPTIQESIEYFGTASPGDAWSVSANTKNSTCTLTWDHGTSLKTDDDVLLNGTYSLLPSGAYKFVINKVTPPVSSIPADGSAIFYGLEIPKTAAILIPAGSISKRPMITMNLKDGNALKGANGSYGYNMIRTAFPLQGFNHITSNGCWGVFNLRIDEAAGQGYNLGGNEYTMSCAEHDMTASVTCQQTGSPAIVGSNTVASAKISPDGFVEQTAGIDVRKFTGQFSKDLLVMDNGEGGGGTFFVKKADVSFDDFSGTSQVYSGVSETYDRSGTNATLTTTMLKLQFVQTDSAVIKPVTNFETDQFGSNPTAAIKLKSVSNGLMKGYLYLIGQNIPRMPFVAIGRKDGTQRIFSFVSGRLTPSSSTQADQIVAHFITR